MKRKMNLGVFLVVSLVLFFAHPAYADFLRAVQLYNTRNYGEAFNLSGLNSPPLAA
jgi:hypothetical protein